MKRASFEETRFIYNGHICVVSFNACTLCRCGYVMLTPSDRLFGKQSPQWLAKISCHGDMTWSRSYLPYKNEHLSGEWWIGFDCAHMGDGIDDRTIKTLGWELDSEMWDYIDETNAGNNFGIPVQIWTNEMCVNELKRIVDQVNMINNEQKEKNA